MKFVVGPMIENDEMEEVIKLFKAQGVDWSYGLCPTGAREEEQTAGAGKVAGKAFKRGYNVAARVLFTYLVMQLELNMAKKYKRNKLERKLDEYNHTMELIRTISPPVLILQAIILMKIL